MKLFKSTSFYIRLLTTTIYDLRFFLFIYGISLWMFGTVVLILNKQKDYDNYDPDSLISHFFGIETMDSVFSIYLVSLGEFEIPTENFADSDMHNFVYFFFVLATFLTTIIMLNMIIAIMARTYDNETAIEDQSALKAQILIVSDYTFLLNEQSAEEWKHPDIYQFKRRNDDSTIRSFA